MKKNKFVQPQNATTKNPPSAKKNGMTQLTSLLSDGDMVKNYATLRETGTEALKGDHLGAQAAAFETVLQAHGTSLKLAKGTAFVSARDKFLSALGKNAAFAQGFDLEVEPPVEVVKTANGKASPTPSVKGMTIETEGLLGILEDYDKIVASTGGFKDSLEAGFEEEDIQRMQAADAAAIAALRNKISASVAKPLDAKTQKALDAMATALGKEDPTYQTALASARAAASASTEEVGGSIELSMTETVLVKNLFILSSLDFEGAEGEGEGDTAE